MRERIHAALKAPKLAQKQAEREIDQELPELTPPEFKLQSELGTPGDTGGGAGGDAGPGGNDAPGGNGAPSAGAPNGGGGAGGNKGGNNAPKPSQQAQAAKDKKSASKAPPAFNAKASKGAAGGAPPAPQAKAPGVFKGPKPKSNNTGLPDDVKARMEQLIGMDLSGIKMRPNSRVAIQNKANALVKGNEVHFAPGKFNPNSQQGKKLIGHEVAHIKQQSEGRVKETAKENGLSFNDAPSLEKEADKLGDKAATQEIAKNAMEQAELKKPNLPYHKEVIQRQEDPYARYHEMLEWATTLKQDMTTKVQTQKDEVTTKSDTEKEALTTMVETTITSLNTSIDSAVTQITTGKDTTISAINDHRTAKLQEINQAADDEITKVQTLIQTKQEALITSGEDRATRITTHADTEASRATSQSSNNAGQIDSAISSASSNNQHKEGIDDATSAAREKATETKAEFIALGDEMASSVKQEASSMAGEIRSDATATGAEFNQPMADTIAKINEKRTESTGILDGAGTEFITNLETETAEVITELESQKGTQGENLQQFPLGAQETLDQAVSDAHTVLERENTKVMGEVDDFVAQLAEIGWYSEEIEAAQADLEAAVAEHDTEMTTFLTDTYGKMSEATQALQPELDDFVSQVNTILTDMESAFSQELSTKQSEITSEMDTTASETVSEIGTVADNMEPDLDQAVADAEASWDEEVDKKETEMSDKVDEGLEGQRDVLSDFSSQLSSEFGNLPDKDRAWYEEAWDAVSSVFEFIGGVLVGLFVGLWEMIKGIGSIFSSWANFLIAVVVIIVAVLVIAAIAAIAGISFGLAALIVGIVVGLAMAGYYIYLAATTEGLSPYERGKLVGRGIFEGIMAFVGTGVLARLVRWSGKIGQIGSVVAKVGGIAKFLPILLKIDDVGRVINLINKVDDAARLGPLIDKAADANKLVTMLENAADAGRVMDILDGASDINAIISKVDDVGQLVSLVDKAGDIGQLETLLTHFDDMAVLDNLLSQVDNGEQLTRLVDFFGDGAKLDDFLKTGAVTDARALDDLINSRGFRDGDQLSAMIDEAGSFDSLTAIMDKTGDAASAERYLAQLKVVKDKLIAAGLRAADDGSGTIRYTDDAGREIAILENGTLRYVFGGHGGDIIISDPSVTTTIVGKWSDPLHPDWGTQYILGLDEPLISRMSGNPGGINVLDLPDSEYQAMLARYGEEAGKQRFWDTYNAPFLEEAFANGHTVRVLSDTSDPATRTGFYAKELDTIEGFYNDSGVWVQGLAERFGYVFDAATNSWTPAHRAGH